MVIFDGHILVYMSTANFSLNYGIFYIDFSVFTCFDAKLVLKSRQAFREFRELVVAVKFLASCQAFREFGELVVAAVKYLTSHQAFRKFGELVVVAIK